MSKEVQPTPAELKATFAALAKEIGPKCEITASVEISRVHALQAFVRPKPYRVGVENEYFLVYADTWADLAEAVRAEWAKRSDNSRAQTIRDMALAIIRITADLGQCTDAALRAEFDPSDVERFGGEAVSMADEMAANGPFNIVETAGANARAA